jgi:hypothetical protein
MMLSSLAGATQRRRMSIPLGTDSLVRAGVDARMVQSLALHTSPNMTLGVYAKLSKGAERKALERLPTLTLLDTKEATGTDGESLAPSLDNEVAEARQTVPLHAVPNAAEDAEDVVASAEGGGGGGNRTRVPISLSVGSNLLPEKGFAAIACPAPAPPRGVQCGVSGSLPSPDLAPIVHADSKLTALIQRWPALPHELREAILRVAGLVPLPPT